MIVASFLLWLLSLAAGAVQQSTTPPTNLSLVMLQDPTALCLDGSPGAFYYAKGSGNGQQKWLLFHEGKGWCLSPSECVSHTQAPDGRGGWKASNGECLPPTLSRRFPEDYLGQHIVNNTRQLSDDPVANPIFYDWNVVWIKTCDGGSFTGTRGGRVLVNNTEVYYRGRYILDAIIEELKGRGIENATDVVVGGGSAGALATYLNIDHYRNRIDPAKEMKFRGLPDGGFFMDLNSKGYHDAMKWIASAAGMNSSLHPTCATAHPSTPELCMFAPHMAQYIETPILALQSRFDSYQIPNILGTEDVQTINSFGNNMTSLMAASIMKRPGNAIFVDSCRHHCEGWDMYKVNGWTEAEAFTAWYNGGVAKLPSAGHIVDASVYPCETCVCEF